MIGQYYTPENIKRACRTVGINETETALRSYLRPLCPQDAKYYDLVSMVFVKLAYGKMYACDNAEHAWGAPIRKGLTHAFFKQQDFRYIRLK